MLRLLAGCPHNFSLACTQGTVGRQTTGHRLARGGSKGASCCLSHVNRMQQSFGQASRQAGRTAQQGRQLAHAPQAAQPPPGHLAPSPAAYWLPAAASADPSAAHPQHLRLLLQALLHPGPNQHPHLHPRQQLPPAQLHNPPAPAGAAGPCDAVPRLQPLLPQQRPLLLLPHALLPLLLMQPRAPGLPARLPLLHPLHVLLLPGACQRLPP